MDDGETSDRKGPPLIKGRAKRLAGVQLAEDLVTNGLRTLFLREIESAAPEVLRALRLNVLPEYVKAYDATRQTSSLSTSLLFRPEGRAFQKALTDWAKEFRLVHKRTPPVWVVQQAETTLELWARHPDWILEREHWFTGITYTIPRRPQIFVIELPQFTWNWEHGYETARSAKKRIIAEVSELLDKRLAEMEKAIKILPRISAKRGPEHFTWTVLHQIRRIRFEVLAKQSNVSAATVKNAVMALKQEVGVSLPKGRPKKK